MWYSVSVISVYMQYIRGSEIEAESQPIKLSSHVFKEINMPDFAEALLGNIIEVIADNKSREKVPTDAKTWEYCKGMLKEYSEDIYKGIDITEENIVVLNSITVLILLVRRGKYKATFKILKKFLKTTYDTETDLDQFYDEVLNRHHKGSHSFQISHKDMTKEEALLRHLFIEFLVKMIDFCHTNHKYLDLFIKNEVLIRKSIEKTVFDSCESFIFAQILDEYKERSDLDFKDKRIGNLITQAKEMQEIYFGA